MIILALLGGGGFGIYKFFFQKKQPQKTVQTQKATTAKAENVVLVPVSAIQTKDGESYVTVVTDDNENGTQTKVETGIINDTYAQITSGVSEGDQIKTITRSSSSSDEKSDMKGGMDAPSGGGMPSGGKQ